jgi:hypothetical protein
MSICRFTHSESPPHTWAISWTTSRTIPATLGGNFYLAKYGVLICSAPNTAIVWQPRDAHGTTLPWVEHSDRGRLYGEVYQSGYSFATPDRLLTTINRFKEQYSTEDDVRMAVEQALRKTHGEVCEQESKCGGYSNGE